MPETKVEVAFELTIGDTPYFRLDDPVKGKLNNTNYRLAGPIWIDITSKVAAVNIKRGKNRELERYNAGNASIVLHNEDRTFDPLNASSPYAGNIIPRRAVRVSTSGYTQFTGVIEDWNLDYDVSGKSTASIIAADAFTLIAQQSLTAGTATTQTTGERINAVLSMPSVAWPLTQRNIDTGSSQVGADVWTADDSALSYMQSVEASEQGQLFMDCNGYVRFVNGAVTPTSGALTTVRTNLVTNPSFEVNTTGWSATGSTATRVTTEYYSGSASIRCVTNGTVANERIQINVAQSNPGATYTASAWIKGTAGAALDLRLSNNVNNAVATTFVATGNWQRVSVSNYSAGTAHMTIQIRTQGTLATTFYADAVMLEQTSTLGDYFDGNSTDSITKIYSWTGTPNASTSVQQRTNYPLFSDEGDGIPYVSATVSYGTELLYNQVTVTAPGFTSTGNNTDSQARYGITTTDVNTLLSSGNAVQSLSQYWVNKYGEPEYRFQDLEVSLDGLSGTDATRVLNIELGDIVQIKFTPNGVGDVIERYGQVNKIEHSIGADRHNVVFGFGSLQYSFLVLDDVGFGILDQNAMAF